MLVPAGALIVLLGCLAQVQTEVEVQARTNLGRKDGGITGYVDKFAYRLEDYEWKEIPGLKQKLDCAYACDAEKKCRSFDWSPAAHACWLSKESPVTQKEGLRKRNSWGNYMHEERAKDHCPAGASINNATYRCYTVSEDKKNWQDSVAQCQYDGGRPAAIPDSEAQATLIGTTESYWIGLNNLDDPDTFFWQWGTTRTVRLREYDNWGDGQPADTDTKNCVYVDSSDGKWYTDDCNTTRAYACEFRPKNDREVYPLCQEDWVGFDRRCYNLYRRNAGYNYEKATKVCSNKDAGMTSLTDEEQIDYVLDYLNEKYLAKDTSLNIWIGLTRDETSGALTWADGTAYSQDIPGTLTIDSSQTLNCVALVWTGDWFTWAYRDCDEANAVVCEGKPRQM